MRIITLLFLFLNMILIIYCSNNPIESIPDDFLTRLDGVTIVYSLISDTDTQNRINYSNNDLELFKDEGPRLNVKISPDKKNLIYVKNALLHPWFGYRKSGPLFIAITENMGKTETILMNSDSVSSAYFIEWISNNKIAVSSQEGSANFISIVDIEGKVLYRKQIDSIYQLFMLPDGQHLVAFNYEKFGVLDVLANSFQEFDPEIELAAYRIPFFTDSSFIITTSNNEFIEYNLTSKIYEKVLIQDNGGRLIFANANHHVYFNYELDKPLRLFQAGSIIDSVATNGYSCEIGLFLSEGMELYFVGESMTVDDEGVIIKVNFNTDQVSKLTEHGEDNFINDISFYEF